MNRIPISCIAALIIQGGAPLLATDYFVSPTGDDNQTGTLASPFATIQKAVDLVTAGDSIYLRGGNYHETVSLAGKNGSARIPITITNYNNESVILDGRIPLSSTWIQHSGNIYKTTLSEDIWQLWVDDKAMTLARWPNSKVWTNDFWNQSLAWAMTDINGSNANAWVQDQALTSIGTSLAGCIMVMNSRDWKSRASVVTSHTANSNTFNYSPPLADYSSGNKRYFLTGLPLLDSDEEWFYDSSSKELYLWADNGQDPTGRIILGKNQSYFFNGGSSASDITFEGLTFIGTTVTMANCKNISLLHCDFIYPVASKRTLGSYSDSINTNLANCDYLQVIDCTFQYADGRPLVAPNCDYPVIENNLFYQIDYACLASKSNSYTLQIDGAKAPIYRRNEIVIAGASEGCRIDGDAYPNGALAEYNYHTRTGLMQGDGASIQYPPGGSNDSINRYNWFIDLDNSGLRFDGNPGGEWGNAYRNVVALGGTRGFQFKGDWQEVYNNAGMDYSKEDINISKIKGPVAYNGEANHNTTVINNASNDTLTNNYATNVITNWDAVNESGTLRDEMRDPDNLDFRPKSGSALIDAGTVISSLTMEGSTVVTLDISSSYNGAGPDIGPYEHGDTDYFIPGRILPRASHPVPPSETTTAKADCDLMWLQGANAISHLVYFGTQSGKLAFMSNQTNNIFTPSEVHPGVTYFWRIDTVTSTGVTTGEEWSFTPEVTGPIPHPIALNDFTSTSGNTQLSIPVLANDSDDGQPASLSIQSVSRPSFGTAIISGTNILYTADGGKYGTDQFVYSVTDGQYIATATVTINVTVPISDLWLPLNETTGNTVDDAGGNITGTHSGIADSEAVHIVGKHGYALNFDGTDDQVNLSDLALPSGSSPRTITAWIRKPDEANSDNQVIFGYGANANGARFSFHTSNEANQYLRVEVQGGFILADKTKLNDSQWHHVAVVIEDDVTNVTEAKLYVDGALETIGNSGSQTLNTSATGTPVIGGSSHSDDDNFKGDIDEVRVFGAAKSAEEIAALASAPDQAPTSWLYRHFGNTSPAWSSDEDNDGSNLRGEYAFGSNPHRPDRDAIKPTAAYNPTNDLLEVTYTRRKAGTHQLNYTVEVSEDLNTWTLPSTELSSIPHPVLGNDFIQVVVEAGTSHSTITRQFIRIKAE